MQLSRQRLQSYWEAAAVRTPTLVVGGGRWGRTWARALTDAMGTADPIVVAARSDFSSAYNSMRSDPVLKGCRVTESIESAFHSYSNIQLAIVASRPKNHLEDTISLAGYGVPVLVEKPLSHTAESARQLFASMTAADQVLAIGTEFAFLPIFHQLVKILRATGEPAAMTLKLVWQDPVDDMREGEIKKRHNEAGLLADLLPHAISIFRIFSGQGEVVVIDAYESEDSEHGHLVMRSSSGALLRFECDIGAATRVRHLDITTNQHQAMVNFASWPPQLILNSETVAPDPLCQQMNSTLRLELGAFKLASLNGSQANPIVDDIGVYVTVQQALEGLLRRS